MARRADMDKPVGYLYRTAMNLFRKRYRRVVIVLRKAVSVELREDEFATAEDRSLVAAALAQLAPRQSVMAFKAMVGRDRWRFLARALATRSPR